MIRTVNSTPSGVPRDTGISPCASYQRMVWTLRPERRASSPIRNASAMGRCEDTVGEGRFHIFGKPDHFSAGHPNDIAILVVVPITCLRGDTPLAFHDNDVIVRNDAACRICVGTRKIGKQRG